MTMNVRKEFFTVNTDFLKLPYKPQTMKNEFSMVVFICTVQVSREKMIVNHVTTVFKPLHGLLLDSGITEIDMAHVTKCNSCSYNILVSKIYK